MEIIHAFRSGKLSVTNLLLKSDYPYPTSASVEPWVGYLFSFCDGKRSSREVLAALHEADVVTEELGEAPFLGILTRFIGEGLLEIPEHALPVPTSPSPPA
jgi:hypothetical protein